MCSIFVGFVIECLFCLFGGLLSSSFLGMGGSLYSHLTVGLFKLTRDWVWQGQLVLPFACLFSKNDFFSNVL